MQKVHTASKARYDDNRIEKKFTVGDLVLFYKPFRAVGKVEKLLHRWLGPYVVIAELSEVNYEIRLASGKKKSSEIQRVSRRNSDSFDSSRRGLFTHTSSHLYSLIETQARMSQKGASG